MEPATVTAEHTRRVERFACAQVHTAELNCVRTSLLDYFGAQRALGQIWMWERAQGLEQETARFLQRVARDLAWPADAKHTVDYMTDESALMMKNFPEFRAFRDVAFYCKFFVNPDKAAFPPRAEWVQVSALTTPSLVTISVPPEYHRSSI